MKSNTDIFSSQGVLHSGADPKPSSLHGRGMSTAGTGGIPETPPPEKQETDNDALIDAPEKERPQYFTLDTAVEGVKEIIQPLKDGYVAVFWIRPPRHRHLLELGDLGCGQCPAVRRNSTPMASWGNDGIHKRARSVPARGELSSALPPDESADNAAVSAKVSSSTRTLSASCAASRTHG